MRWGLRWQLLVLLGALLLGSFVLLYFATATYARATLQSLQLQHGRELGQAVAAQIAAAQGDGAPARLERALEACVASGASAVATYDTRGTRGAWSGSRQILQSLEGAARDWSQVPPGNLVRVSTPQGNQLMHVSRGVQGAIVVAFEDDSDRSRAPALVRSLAVYTGLIGLALLVAAYFALTRWIVRPMDAVSRAVQQIAGGSRRLDLPPASSQDFAVLGQNLRVMAERLAHHEEALTAQVHEARAAREDLKRTQDRLLASERLASIGSLATSLAHEIGNPIAALTGMQELLLDGELEPAQQRDFLQRMRKETERIHRILRDLLLFARAGVQGPGQERDVIPGSVETAVQDSAALLLHRPGSEPPRLTLDIQADLPPVALSSEKLVQVLLNLGLNALDACGPGGKIEISARRDAKCVELAVSDDGPGVAKSVREQIFEPFFTTKEVGSGTGLGLAVCRALVESAGGSVLLDTEYYQGSRFVVRLPEA